MSFQYYHWVGDCAFKSRLLLSNVEESMFANDAALLSSSREDFEPVASSFVAVAKGWGLTASLVKSKSNIHYNSNE